MPPHGEECCEMLLMEKVLKLLCHGLDVPRDLELHGAYKKIRGYGGNYLQLKCRQASNPFKPPGTLNQQPPTLK